CVMTWPRRDEALSPLKRWPNRTRLKNFQYSNDHAYHLVFNTAEHRPLLRNQLAALVERSLRDAAEATHHELLAYVVMPDHVHALVQGTSDDSDAVRFVQRAKQRPGFEYKRATGRQLWLPSFYDRIVRRGDDAREIAAYIYANPERAGLVSADEEWPFRGG